MLYPPQIKKCWSFLARKISLRSRFLVETSYFKLLLSRQNCYKHYHHWCVLDNQNQCTGICSHNQLELTERHYKTLYSFKTQIHYHFGKIKQYFFHQLLQRELKKAICCWFPLLCSPILQKLREYWAIYLLSADKLCYRLQEQIHQ